VLLSLLKSKIHRATVTQVAPSYEGSIALDQDLMEASGITEFEKVLVANLANGARFETYCIKGGKGGGEISVNGAAARLASPGDLIIVMSFASYTPEEAQSHRPKVVRVDGGNRIVAS
jgi:aspartate 1-decarboxylase